MASAVMEKLRQQLVETVDAMRGELAKHVDTIGPVVEGYRDWERALAKPEEASVKKAVNAHIGKLQQRLDLSDVLHKALTAETDAVQKALARLDEDGFALVPDLILSAADHKIFMDNVATIDAATQPTKPLPEPATGGDFTLGEAQDKVPPEGP